MGDGFSVVPRELTDAATTIRDMGEQLAGSQALGYGIGQRAVGDATLAAAMDEAQQASQRTAWMLDMTSRATADRLTNIAATYENIDRAQADMITADGEPPITG